MAEPGVLRHQPLKALYLSYIALYTLVNLPLWVVTNIVPSWRTRPSWSLGRALSIKASHPILNALFVTGTFPRIDPAKMQKDERNGLRWVEPRLHVLIDELKEAARINNVGPARVAVYWYGKRDASGKVGYQAEADEKVIYHIHGSGFVMANASPKGHGAHASNQMLKHFRGFDRLVQVEYRKSQGPPFAAENGYPAALLDVLTVYDYLISDLGFKPKNILVTGDSTGGNLVVALARAALRHSAWGVPGGALVVSGSLDWGRSGFAPDSSIVECWYSDSIHPFIGPYPIRALLGALPMSEASLNPWVSPASLRLNDAAGMFKGFPPTCIVVGGAEMSRDESRVLRDRMVADMGEKDVKYFEVPDGIHTCMFAKSGDMEEADAGFQELAAWVARVFD